MGSRTYALTQNQLDTLSSGVLYFNTEDSGCTGSGCTCSSGGSGGALVSGVSPEWQPILTQAGNVHDVDPSIIAAILFAENNGPEALTGGGSWPTFTKAQADDDGPFQFTDKNTWAAYGGGSIKDPLDSATAAAKYIKSYSSKVQGAAPGSESDPADKESIRKPNRDTMYKIAVGFNAGPGTWRGSSGLWEQPNGVWENITPGKQKEISAYPLKAIEGYRRAQGDLSGTIQPSTTSCSNSNGAVAGDIVKTAINLSYPDRGHVSESDAKQEYIDAVNKSNSTAKGSYTDCGMFVSTVMRASGADTDFPPIGTGNILPYVKNSSKYETFDDITSTDRLKPGDILVFNANSKGHIYLFVGSEGGELNSRGASLTEHVPEGHNAYFNQDGNKFTVARLL
jgi:hypothetical protein